jgi:hypothetical protein
LQVIDASAGAPSTVGWTDVETCLFYVKTRPAKRATIGLFSFAGLAHPVEQLICNHQVGGSSPSAGTNKKRLARFSRKAFFLLPTKITFVPDEDLGTAQE